MAKEECDGLKKIEIWWLGQHGYLDGYKSGTIQWTHGWSGDKSSISITGCTWNEDKYIQFRYTQTDYYSGEKNEFDYRIPLTTTPCRLGGKRYWFICSLSVNGVYCGRRVGVLYKASDYFGCRSCQNLTYSSKKVSQRNPLYASMRILETEDRAEKLRAKIKRPYYAGRPTRRQRRFMQLENTYYSRDLLEAERLLLLSR